MKVNALSEFQLVPNVQKSRKLNQNSFLLERQKQGSRDTRIDIDCLILVALTFIVSYLRKVEKLPNISRQKAGLLFNEVQTNF